MTGKKRKLGLALGAGALRGLCHLGFLQVLKDEGITADYVAGTSIGAVIGSLYAAGIDLKTLADIAKHLRLRHLVDPVFPRQGLLQGKNIMEILQLFLRDITFAELQIPLAVVATDLASGREVVFREGPVVEAVRASISIPGIFTPLRQGRQVLVDGALVNRVPISTVRAMGAEKVIAVSINPSFCPDRLNNVAEIILQSFALLQTQVVADKLQEADLVIEPRVGDINPASLDDAERCIEEGAEAARRFLPQIKALLNSPAPQRW
ncbi:MAG: patatin-like phospholipase family protein [bacterium]|jgi:NTE family protein|nr:patatin-like phospholipase family protein [Bacillota bacterium]HHW54214.1 patatin family protein [Bacillota bacterium]